MSCWPFIPGFWCLGKAGVLKISLSVLDSVRVSSSGLAVCDLGGDEGIWGGTIIRAENGVGSIKGAGSSLGTTEVRDEKCEADIGGWGDLGAIAS